MSDIRCRRSMLSLKARGQGPPCFLAGPPWLPWPVDVYSNLCFCRHWRSLVRLSLHPNVPLKGTPSVESGYTLIRCDLIVTRSYTWRPYFETRLGLQVQDASTQPHRGPVWEEACPVPRDEAFTRSSVLCGFSPHLLGLVRCYVFYLPL